MIDILLPTYNEQDNISECLRRIRASMNGCQYNIVVIDDGTDETEHIARAKNALVVKGDRKGLSSAVIKGIGLSTADYIVVMDADLQHPPELLPLMIKELQEYDLVIGSRYCKGGSVGDWDATRLKISKLANLLSLHLAPGVKDRLTGFFAFRREYVPVEKLNPIGFKILLEVLVKSPFLHVKEIPMAFGIRKAGESKADTKVGIAYLKQVVGLTFHSKMFRFALVGLSGAVIKIGLMVLLVELAELHFMLAYLIAASVSIVNNYTWNSLWTFKHHHSDLMGLGRYAGVSSLTISVNEVVLYLLTGLLGVWYVYSTVVAIGIAFLINFILSRKVVWHKRKSS